MIPISLKSIDLKRRSEKMSEIVGESFDDLSDDSIENLRNNSNVINSVSIISYITGCY